MNVEEERSPEGTPAGLAYLAGILSGAAFPIFALVVLVLVFAATVALLLIPPATGALGSFAEDFKVWCFGYEPGTGAMRSSAVVEMLATPLPLMTLLVLVWYQPLRAAFHGGVRAFLAPTLAALVVVSAGGGALAA